MADTSFNEQFGREIGPGTVRIERILPGPVERVWSYLTDSEKRGQWLASGQMDLRVGGAADLTFRHSQLSDEPAPEPYAQYEGYTSHGHITEIDPPRLLSFVWPSEGDESEVTFELSKEGNDTLMVITHKRLPSRKEMANVAGGWHAHLAVLIDRLSGRKPQGFWTNVLKCEKQYQEMFAAG